MSNEWHSLDRFLHPNYIIFAKVSALVAELNEVIEITEKEKAEKYLSISNELDSYVSLHGANPKGGKILFKLSLLFDKEKENHILDKKSIDEIEKVCSIKNVAKWTHLGWNNLVSLSNLMNRKNALTIDAILKSSCYNVSYDTDAIDNNRVYEKLKLFSKYLKASKACNFKPKQVPFKLFESAYNANIDFFDSNVSTALCKATRQDNVIRGYMENVKNIPVPNPSPTQISSFPKNTLDTRESIITISHHMLELMNNNDFPQHIAYDDLENFLRTSAHFFTLVVANMKNNKVDIFADDPAMDAFVKSFYSFIEEDTE